MKRRKDNIPRVLEVFQRIPKAALISAACVAAGIGVLALFAALTSRLPLFTVKYILRAPGSAPESLVDLSYLKGKNIFDIDLQAESLRVSRRYPSFKKITLLRVLPDRIGVAFTTRYPLARVKLGKVYLLSEDLVFFEQPRETEGAALPLITGLEKKIPAPLLGRSYAYRDLLIAVEILRGCRMHRGLQGYRVEQVDIGNLDDITFSLEKPVPQAQAAPGFSPPPAIAATGESIEVKISQENLRNKVKLLSDLFLQLKSATDTIKYVDLRFSDPVIKLKEATEK